MFRNIKTAEMLEAEVTANIQTDANVIHQAYLASTDWYITRHAETAVAVPADVTTARAAARAAIV
jgi:hypothetical protein